jgi:prepilin-type N-terminal cleavage/methylation domain-containing protein
VRRGFTLVETLITLVLLAALTGLVLPVVIGRFDPMAFDEAARQLEAALRLAQADAKRSGTVVRVTASRPAAGEAFVVVGAPLGPDEDWAEVWADTATNDGSDSPFGTLEGIGGVGPELPVPDAAVPEQAYGLAAGRVLLSLPRGVVVERAAGADESDGFGEGDVFGGIGGIDAGDSRPLFAGGDASGSMEPGFGSAGGGVPGAAITIAILLHDGSAMVAPGASLVRADGTRAVMSVDQWTGRIVVAVRDRVDADPFERPEDDEVPDDGTDGIEDLIEALPDSSGASGPPGARP